MTRDLFTESDFALIYSIRFISLDRATEAIHSVPVFACGLKAGEDNVWIQNTWPPEEWGDNGIGAVSAHLFGWCRYPDINGISLEIP